jgi:hypothetical protein
MDQPSGAPIAERQNNPGNQQTKHQPSRSLQSYVQAMGTAMQALQLLLALPLLSCRCGKMQCGGLDGSNAERNHRPCRVACGPSVP